MGRGEKRPYAVAGIRPRGRPGHEGGDERGIQHRSQRGMHGLEHEHEHRFVDIRYPSAGEALGEGVPGPHPVIDNLTPIEEHTTGVRLELEPQSVVRKRA